MKLKRCQVVILPTNEKVPTTVTQSSTSGKLFFNRTSEVAKNHIEWEGAIPVNIYIVSEDDELKAGDSIIEDLNEHGLHLNAHSPISMNENFHRIGKVIASTNLDLSLPNISKGFIEKLCKKGNIDKVMVEYVNKKFSHYSQDLMKVAVYEDNWEPKVKNNKITIKPVINNYNRVEVIALLDKFQQSKLRLEEFVNLYL